jgi:nucleotide-binding universal stress UspA family protein
MKVKPAAKPGAVTVEINRRDEQILEEANRPAVEPLAIRKILVPIDFSEFSYKSLDYAVAFALHSRAEITLMHVVPLTYVDAEVIAFDFSKIEQQTAAACQSRLERLREQRVSPRVQSSTAVVIGRPVEEIISTARKLDADLIIMSTHGYTGLKHAFLGSTTENVVRYAPCPVLTLRESEHDFVRSATGKESIT